MMDDQSYSKPTSWLTRTHFTRAICHRTSTVVAPLTSILPNIVDSQPVAHPVFEPPISSGITHSDSLSSYRFRNDGNDFSKIRREDSFEHSKPDSEFSFPSLPLSMNCSDEKGHSKAIDSACFSYWLSPTGDEEMGSGCSSTAASPSPSWFSLSTVTSSTTSSVASRSSERSLAYIDSFNDSRSSFLSARSSSEDWGDDSGRKGVSRSPSWSQYFRKAGDESALLSLEKWMVDLSQLLLGQRIASGAHSRLHEGMYKGDHVAVKIIRQPDDDEVVANRLERLFTQEVTTLSCLHHRNVVQLVAACKKPPVLCVITEYVSGGSLRAFLHKQEGQPLPLKKLVSMALDIASAMEYLHRKGVIHRDLKSENLVLSDDLCVKVVDFGVACFESHCDFKAEDPGTYRWMAPEMICHKRYTRKVDVYSFGVVLWELLTGHLPFEEISPVQAAFAVVHKNARPPIPANCPSALERLMNRCWSTNPDERPEFCEILRMLQQLEEDCSGDSYGMNFSPERNPSLPSWLQR